MPVAPKKPVKEPGICIHKDMRVQEVVALFPPAAGIMSEYGLHCFACSIGGVETLEEGCRMHGLGDEEIAELLDDISTAMAEAPQREWALTVTPAAAEGIAAIAAAEGRTGQVLRVVVDESGGFCLEFCESPDEFDRVFSAPEKPDVSVCASPLALQRVGGAVIDMRDGRFKLDLPEDSCAPGGCAGACACEK